MNPNQESQGMLPFGEKPEGGKAGGGQESDNPPRAESAEQEEATLPKLEEGRKLNHYEQRLEDKRERMEEAAEKAQARSDSAFGKSHQIGGMIPMGQPILVGHHSERRHRKDLERIDNSMRKGVEQAELAEELTRRAANLGASGISADDPDAITKLQSKLEGMESNRELMKRVNRQFRKGGVDAVEDISEGLRQRLKEQAESTGMKAPFESWQLSNLGANIRRVKERIERLAVEREAVSEEVVEGDGYQIKEDAVLNRIQFDFDQKPDTDTRRVLKQNGFRRAPSIGVWQRQLNAAGRMAAERVRVQLDRVEE